MSEYGINNIKHLETREAMRTRINVYLGSDDTEGIYQSLKEIINNSTDEALAGFGKKIEICLNEDNNMIEVRDFGRGCPFGVENGRNTLVAIYTETHTGGKFDKGAYKNSSGLNGLGGTCVNMSSEYFYVQSFRNGVAAKAIFDKGILKEYAEEETKELNGTLVRFIPDKEVFKNSTENFSYQRICSEIKNISYLNKGIRFIVKTTKGENKEFFSQNGISDFIKDKAKSPLMNNPIVASAKDESDEVEIAFMWTKDTTQDYVFVNGLYCPNGGSPITGAKTTITNMIKKLSNKDFNPELIRKGLIYAINCKVSQPSFSDQTKNKILNTNLRKLASDAFKEGLEEFSHLSEFSALIDGLERLQKAEKAADKAREAVLNHTKEMQAIKKQKLAFIDKLSDAEILGQDSILCICEGDSSGSSIAMGRDTKKYGILRIRGKMLNCLKADVEKILQNEEIKLLLHALGIDINNYNSSKLRYGKVAICADQDDDGRHIALLIMANLYKLCPQFLKENRLYWLQSPLFIEYDKNNNPKSWYYSDEDFNKVRKTVSGTIKRVKGLGQLSEKDLKATMFSTTGNQKMDLIEYSENGVEQLKELMGEDISPRKVFVFNKIDFSKYGEI